MILDKEVFLMMSEETLKGFSAHPGAFRAWVACMFEEITAEEMYGRAEARDKYRLSRATLLQHGDFINKAMDEYIIMSCLPTYE